MPPRAHNGGYIKYNPNVDNPIIIPYIIWPFLVYELDKGSVAIKINENKIPLLNKLLIIRV